MVYDRMHILLQAGLYLLLRKKILSAKNLQMTKTIYISLFIILLISVVGKAIATSSKNYDRNYYLSIALILLICLGVFYRILSFLNENRAIQEKAIISQRIETSKKQYESLKTDRETINTLSHDIKHQLVYLQSKVTEDDLSRLKESVKSYDNTWNTGNKVIDTLLYDRQIKCNEKKISITCLCDPTAINQRNQIHLYFLITNILDNAMEACEKVDEKDRCISLVIRKDKEKTIIEESNYFSGQRQIVNNSLATSKKARKVVMTSVNLSSRAEGEEMFGSSRAARSMVRGGISLGNTLALVVPNRILQAIDGRFHIPANVSEGYYVQPSGSDVSNAETPAYDLVRASVNLVVAALLIALGTSLKLPLSTTFVTFMVAMGTSLADRAWTRESAVFRVTGVLTVIGGWFITAGVAFVACMGVALLMHAGGKVAMVAVVVAVVVILVRNQRSASRQSSGEEGDALFARMMASNNPLEVEPLLGEHVMTNTASQLASLTKPLAS